MSCIPVQCLYRPVSAVQFCPLPGVTSGESKHSRVSTILGTARASRPVTHHVPSVPYYNLTGLCTHGPWVGSLLYTKRLHSWRTSFQVWKGKRRKRREVVVWRFVCLVVSELFCLFIFPLWLNGGEWHIITLHGRENISQALVWICQSMCVCMCVCICMHKCP